jgi:segregation and condensation protein B
MEELLDAEIPEGERSPDPEAERASPDAATRGRGDTASAEGEAGAELEAEGAGPDAATRGHGDTASPEGEGVADLDADGASPDEETPGRGDTERVEGEAVESLASDDLLAGIETPSLVSTEDSQLKALLEAIVYITEEPLSLTQITTALNQPRERVQKILDELVAEYDKSEHGVTMREVAGGYKMTTKPEHHETVRSFVRSLKPPLKLSLPALETLAVIAYKQPVTAPEIMEIRGVQGAGVLKTLLDRKLIAAAGRKNVIGKPILYKTTKDFLVQFGLKDLTELPSLKEFEEIRRMAIDGDAIDAPEPPAEQKQN